MLNVYHQLINTVCSADSLLWIFKARNKYLFKPNYAHLVTVIENAQYILTHKTEPRSFGMLTNVKARSSQLPGCSNLAGYQAAGHRLFCGISSVLLFTLAPEKQLPPTLSVSFTLCREMVRTRDCPWAVWWSSCDPPPLQVPLFRWVSLLLAGAAPVRQLCASDPCRWPGSGLQAQTPPCRVPRFKLGQKVWRHHFKRILAASPIQLSPDWPAL